MEPDAEMANRKRQAHAVLQLQLEAMRAALELLNPDAEMPERIPPQPERGARALRLVVRETA